MGRVGDRARRTFAVVERVRPADVLLEDQNGADSPPDATVVDPLSVRVLVCVLPLLSV
jgi:hypothetical protein